MTEPKKYAYIDALRGWAILGVLMVHLHYTHASIFPALRYWMEQGARGVQLFYLVSAFTLMLSMHSRKEDNQTRNFFIRRFFRIAPAFWFAIVLFLVVRLIGGTGLTMDFIGWKTILATLTFTHGLHPDWINAVVPGGWSVAVEFSFYCFLPLLARWITDLNRAIVGFVIALGITLLTSAGYAAIFPPHVGTPITAYAFYWLPNQFPVFMLGILLFHLLPFLERWRDSANSFAASCLLLLAGWLIMPKGQTGLAFPSHIQFAIAFTFITAALIVLPHRVLVNPVTMLFGRLSYSLYLTHVLYIYLVSSICQYWLIGRYLPKLTIDLLQIGAVLALSLISSYAMFRFIEQPGIALGKRAIRWLESTQLRTDLRFQPHMPVNEIGSIGS